MNRRAFLSLGVAIVVGGCLGWGNETQKRIAGIRLVNNRPEASTIEVVIEKDGEEVFTDEYRLRTTQDSSTVNVDIPLQKAGRFVLRFRADDQWVSIYPEDYESVDERCIGVSFELHQQSTSGYEIQPRAEC
jgi:hypothetical protein